MSANDFTTELQIIIKVIRRRQQVSLVTFEKHLHTSRSLPIAQKKIDNIVNKFVGECQDLFEVPGWEDDDDE